MKKLYEKMKSFIKEYKFLFDNDDKLESIDTDPTIKKKLDEILKATYFIYSNKSQREKYENFKEYVKKLKKLVFRRFRKIINDIVYKTTYPKYLEEEVYFYYAKKNTNFFLKKHLTIFDPKSYDDHIKRMFREFLMSSVNIDFNNLYYSANMVIFLDYSRRFKDKLPQAIKNALEKDVNDEKFNNFVEASKSKYDEINASIVNKEENSSEINVANLKANIEDNFNDEKNTDNSLTKSFNLNMLGKSDEENYYKNDDNINDSNNNGLEKSMEQNNVYDIYSDGEESNEPEKSSELYKDDVQVKEINKNKSNVINLTKFNSEIYDKYKGTTKQQILALNDELLEKKQKLLDFCSENKKGLLYYIYSLMQHSGIKDLPSDKLLDTFYNSLKNSYMPELEEAIKLMKEYNRINLELKDRVIVHYNMQNEPKDKKYVMEYIFAPLFSSFNDKFTDKMNTLLDKEQCNNLEYLFLIDKYKNIMKLVEIKLMDKDTVEDSLEIFDLNDLSNKQVVFETNLLNMFVQNKFFNSNIANGILLNKKNNFAMIVNDADALKKDGFMFDECKTIGDAITLNNKNENTKYNSIPLSQGLLSYSVSGGKHYFSFNIDHDKKKIDVYNDKEYDDGNLLMCNELEKVFANVKSYDIFFYKIPYKNVNLNCMTNNFITLEESKNIVDYNNNLKCIGHRKATQKNVPIDEGFVSNEHINNDINNIINSKDNLDMLLNVQYNNSIEKHDEKDEKDESFFEFYKSNNEEINSEEEVNNIQKKFIENEDLNKNDDKNVKRNELYDAVNLNMQEEPEDENILKNSLCLGDSYVEDETNTENKNKIINLNKPLQKPPIPHVDNNDDSLGNIKKKDFNNNINANNKLDNDKNKELEKERLEKERIEKEKLEKEKLENEKLKLEKKLQELQKQERQEQKIHKQAMQEQEKEKAIQEQEEKERQELLEKTKQEMQENKRLNQEVEMLEKELHELQEKEKLEKLLQKNIERRQEETKMLKEFNQELQKKAGQKEENKAKLEQEKNEIPGLEKMLEETGRPLQENGVLKQELNELLIERRQLLEKERIEKEKLEKERLEKERIKKERIKKERLEKQRKEEARIIEELSAESEKEKKSFAENLNKTDIPELLRGFNLKTIKYKKYNDGQESLSWNTLRDEVSSVLRSNIESNRNRIQNNKDKQKEILYEIYKMTFRGVFSKLDSSIKDEIDELYKSSEINLESFEKSLKAKLYPALLKIIKDAYYGRINLDDIKKDLNDIKKESVKTNFRAIMRTLAEIPFEKMTPQQKIQWSLCSYQEDMAESRKVLLALEKILYKKVHDKNFETAKKSISQIKNDKFLLDYWDFVKKNNEKIAKDYIEFVNNTMPSKDTNYDEIRRICRDNSLKARELVKALPKGFKESDYSALIKAIKRELDSEKHTTSFLKNEGKRMGKVSKNDSKTAKKIVKGAYPNMIKK